MSKIIFQKIKGKKLIEFIKYNQNRKIFNFLNLETIYIFNKNKKFEEVIKNSNSINILDGVSLSFFLSLKYFEKIQRIRGPTFTKKLLSNKELIEQKKHFFIGIEEKDITSLKKKFPKLVKIKGYNPPHIKKDKFEKEEIEKIAKKINNFNPEFVWIGISSPKQNILSLDLFKKTKTKHFFNIGAALDFILGKKPESPKILRKIGVEWVYRFITDFKHSRKKVWRSIIGLKYLNKIELK